MYYGCMCFVPCTKIKSSQVIKSNHFIIHLKHPLTLPLPINFTIENISNATVSSLADLLALMFAREKISSKCAFGSKFKSQFILLFSLFLLLFMSFTVLFDTIYGSHCTMLTIFNFFLQYF